jgi:hypothetical protein
MPFVFFRARCLFVRQKFFLNFQPTKKNLALRGEWSNIATRFFMGDLKKLNGRPKLKEGRRSKKIDARFTEVEYMLIVDLEKELGVSKTELVRMRMLNNAGNTIINSRELLKHLDNIGAEMGRSGNNINQLAKHANTLRLLGAVPPSVIFKFNELLEDYIRIYKALEVSLRKIIRAMGK